MSETKPVKTKRSKKQASDGDAQARAKKSKRSKKRNTVSSLLC